MTSALRWGWVVSTTPRPLYPRARAGTHCTGGWVGPRAGLDGCRKSRSHRDSIPGPLVRSAVAIPPELTRPLSSSFGNHNNGTNIQSESSSYKSGYWHVGFPQRQSVYPANCCENTSCLRHCVTSRKVAGSIPDGVTGIFHWHNPSGRTVALGSTQPLTEMSTRNISWG